MTTATATTTTTASLYRWEAKRPNAALGQVVDARTTFVPLYPSLASVGLALAGNAMATAAADSRKAKAIRQEVRFVLRAAPRWRRQGTAGALSVAGSWLTLSMGSQTMQRDLRSVQQWALHPRAGFGVVLKFNDAEGYVRIAGDDQGIDALVRALGAVAPNRRFTWTPEPLDHPLPRQLLDANFAPSEGLLSMLVKLMMLAIVVILPCFWPAFVLGGVATLIGCHRDPDTFKAGIRTWILFGLPVVGFIALTTLTS